MGNRRGSTWCKREVNIVIGRSKRTCDRLPAHCPHTWSGCPGVYPGAPNQFRPLVEEEEFTIRTTWSGWNPIPKFDKMKHYLLIIFWKVNFASVRLQIFVFVIYLGLHGTCVCVFVYAHYVLIVIDAMLYVFMQYELCLCLTLSDDPHSLSPPFPGGSQDLFIFFFSRLTRYVCHCNERSMDCWAIRCVGLGEYFATLQFWHLHYMLAKTLQLFQKQAGYLLRLLFSHSKTNSPLWHQVKNEIIKTLKSSQNIGNRARKSIIPYGIVSRARWVISALVSDLSLA